MNVNCIISTNLLIFLITITLTMFSSGNSEISADKSNLGNMSLRKIINVKTLSKLIEVRSLLSQVTVLFNKMIIVVLVQNSLIESDRLYLCRGSQA